jgi:hypothetical protein
MTGREYETDFVLWAEDQARALREAASTTSNLPIDWENVAEEIESLGKAQGRELASRIAAILLHLMKLEASPAVDPRAGWRDTIQEQRDAIERLLADAPSLGPAIPAVVTRELGRARKRVGLALTDHGETPRVDLTSLSYTEGQVIGDWFPMS